MSRFPDPPTKPAVAAYGLLLLAVCIWLIVELTSAPPRTQPTNDTSAPPAAPPPLPASDPDPPCHEIYKFCVGLEELEEQLIDREGQLVDDDHDGRTWRMVTVILQVGLRQGETKGSFGSSSVALIDTEGGRRTNDNARVGLERPHTSFDRQNRRPQSQTYVFLLDEAEEVHCLQVSARSEEICIPVGAP